MQPLLPIIWLVECSHQQGKAIKVLMTRYLC